MAHFKDMENGGGLGFIGCLETQDLTINNIKVFKDAIITDPTRPDGKQKRKGQFFVSMPDALAAILPGSVVDHNLFIKKLGDSCDMAADLISEKVGQREAPIFTHYESIEPDHDFTLCVYNGSTCESAIKIARYAKELLTAGDKKENRVKYQQEAALVMEPIMDKKSQFDLRIIEDCIATGDTIVGALTVLGSLNKGKIRVDVAVATTQGILLLREFAKQNHLSLEINVGYLAYGLSRGLPIKGTEARNHANYLIFPETTIDAMPKDKGQELKEIKGSDRDLFVVGDMGDNFNSLPQEHDDKLPFNKWRAYDPHGEREKADEKTREFRKGLPLILYFASGGYFTRALYRDWLERNHLTLDENELIIRASRVWAKEKDMGFGVILSQVPDNLIDSI